MSDKGMLNNLLSEFEYLKEQEDVSNIIDRWAEYSDKEIGFPSIVQNIIDNLNYYKGFDTSASYGYQILYFAISNGWDLDFTINYFKVDRFGYKVLYPFK